MSLSALAAARHGVDLVEEDGLPAVTLHDHTADLHATWIPQAGMLGASLVHAGEQLLWRGAGAAAYARERAFMGIPFLHPWANRLSGWDYEARGVRVALDRRSPVLLVDDAGLPIHGTLTASPWWTVRRAAAGPDGARLRASLTFDRPELLAAFPFPHVVEIEVVLAGGALEVRTAITPTAGRPVPVAFGFHPYLRLPGLPRSAWDLDLPVGRRLAHDARLIPTGTAEAAEPIRGPVGGRTWDDGFDAIDPPGRLALRGGGRELAVELVDGFPVAQVFAPPGAEYVCLEPMAAPANALAAAPETLRWVLPGRRHMATWRLTVGPGPAR